jgi:hypothetical protein
MQIINYKLILSRFCHFTILTELLAKRKNYYCRLIDVETDLHTRARAHTTHVLDCLLFQNNFESLKALYEHTALNTIEVDNFDRLLCSTVFEADFKLFYVLHILG